MATTYTPNTKLALMGTGDEVDNWGVVQNNAIYTPIDGILGATLPVSMTTTDVTLTLSQWQSMGFTITGVLTGNLNLIFPLSPADSGGTLAVGGFKFIDNQTTGNFTITVKTAASGSVGVVAPQGYRSLVVSDTVNVVFTNNSIPLAVIQSSVASATISSDQNDYAIAATVAYERLNVTTASVLTGITNGAAGRVLTLYNVGTATLTLAANSSSSTSGNRFLVTKPIYLRAGSGIALQYDGTSTGWRPQNLLQADPPASLFTNLAIKVASNTTATITASNVVMTDGTYFLPTGTLSATLNLGSSGNVNQLDAGSIASATWYYVFAISNGITMGTLASLSATAPALPSGYTFFARVGTLRTATGVAQLMGTSQLGRYVQYISGLAQTSVLPKLFNGATGTYSASAPIWASTSIAALVPPTASQIAVNASNTWSANSASPTLVAPNTGYGGPSSVNPPPICIPADFPDARSATMLVESSAVGCVGSGAGSGAVVSGWTENI